MNQKETVEVNGVELEEGTNLWRYAALRTWEQRIGEQKPDEVLSEVAEQLAEKYPDAVNGAPAHIVKSNLRGTPGIYDPSEKVNYHAMEVKNVNANNVTTEIAIIDWKEEKRYCFTDNVPEDAEGSYFTFEPLSALEEHLGVTILPVTGEDDE